MNLSSQVAKNLRDVHFGGNWTDVDLKTSLADVTWKQAVTKVYSFNTIAALVYHINYYVTAVIRVLQGEPLTGSDKYSFDHPTIQTQEDWQTLVDKSWADAESLARLIEQFPDGKLLENFWDGKYGNNYRNITGVIEHTHYHLGQIVLIKKLLLVKDKNLMANPSET
jgi:hypothetical protein